MGLFNKKKNSTDDTPNSNSVNFTQMDIEADFPTPRKGGKVKILLLLLLVIIFAGAGAFFYISNLESERSVIRIERNISTPKTTTQQASNTQKDIDNLNVKSLTEEDYNLLLESKKLSFKSDLSVSFGAVALELSKFWDGEEPSIWLNVKIADIPNINIGEFKAGKIDISYVLGINNTNMHNRPKEESTGLDKEFSIYKNISGENFLSAVRDVQLLSGVKEEYIAGIKGKFTLSLPVEVEIITLNLDKENVAKTSKSGIEVEIVSTNLNEVSVHYKGLNDRLVDVIAYDKNGMIIADSGVVFSEEGEITKYKHGFKQKPATLKVILASKIIKKEYPFILGKKYRKGE